MTYTARHIYRRFFLEKYKRFFEISIFISHTRSIRRLNFYFLFFFFFCIFPKFFFFFSYRKFDISAGILSSLIFGDALNILTGEILFRLNFH